MKAWRVVGGLPCMLKNYFRVALRNLRNSRTYSFINIGGLAVSLAVSVLLMLWVNDELNFDSFNKNKTNLYKLATKFDDANIGRRSSR